MADNRQPDRREVPKSLCSLCGKCFPLTKDNTFIKRFTNPLHAHFSVVTMVCSCTASNHIFAPSQEFIDTLSAAGVQTTLEEFASEALREAFWQTRTGARLSDSDERKIAYFRWQLENNSEELSQWT